jgi:hypothetical protein
MMYGKNREINNLSLVWMMISHPYHHTTYWFLSFACVYFILYGPGLQHMEIHPAAKKYNQTGFEPTITGTYRPRRNHYTTCPVLVLICLIFSLYVNWCFRGQKIRAKRGSNPWSRAPTDHTQTTTPLAQFWFWLVWYFLYMLIDVFCGHLISRKKKETTAGDSNSGQKTPH